MYFDGSLKLEGAGAGVLLISPTGEQLKYVLLIFWKVSNNKAEYEPLLHGLRHAASLGIKWLLVYGDSVVVINQVNKSWDRNKENMDAYCLEVRKLENKFYDLEFHHVVRDNNVAADVLQSLVLLALKYQRLSSSTSFMRHPSQNRPLIQHIPGWTGRHDDKRGLEATLHRLHT
jgi:ribonuclease HI